jgi:hypothetical protein
LIIECFPNQIIYYKRNSVFMNNFYHKVAVASVCTALTFTLGTNQEVKAATFFLPDIQFRVEGNVYNGVGENLVENGGPDFYAVQKLGDFNGPTSPIERRAFSEYNLSKLSLLPPNTMIKHAYLELFFEPLNTKQFYKSLDLDILGYVGNGKPDVSDFGAGEYLGIEDISPFTHPTSGQFYSIKSDVTQFVKARVSNGDTFAGFGLGIAGPSPNNSMYANYGTASLLPSLIIETEPVPEPTTIFGSALALGIGGWLKRKKSNPRGKTTSQH